MSIQGHFNAAAAEHSRPFNRYLHPDGVGGRARRSSSRHRRGRGPWLAWRWCWSCTEIQRPGESWTSLKADMLPPRPRLARPGSSARGRRRSSSFSDGTWGRVSPLSSIPRPFSTGRSIPRFWRGDIGGGHRPPQSQVRPGALSDDGGLVRHWERSGSSGVLIDGFPAALLFTVTLGGGADPDILADI